MTRACGSGGMRGIAAYAHARMHTHGVACEHVPSCVLSPRETTDSKTVQTARGMPYRAVSCSVKKSIQPARCNRCPLAPAFPLAERLSTPRPLLAHCLLFPHGRLSLAHAQSHVLLPCRQFSSRVWQSTPPPPATRCNTRRRAAADGSRPGMLPLSGDANTYRLAFQHSI